MAPPLPHDCLTGVDIDWTRKHLLQNGGAGATLPGTTGEMSHSDTVTIDRHCVTKTWVYLDNLNQPG